MSARREYDAEEFLKLIDKFDWNAGYQWKYELTYLRDHDQAQREKLAHLKKDFNRARLVCIKMDREIARLREALENFVDQFECDFVLDDGTIVDNPPERWRPIEHCYKLAKSALAKEATHDKAE